MLDRRWFRISWRSETQHLLGALHVGLGELGGARHPTRDLRGLLLEVVALAGLLPKDLARAGDPEPLASTGVRLVLRHLFRSLSRGQAARGRPIVSSAWGRGGAASGVDLGVEVLGAPALLLPRHRSGGVRGVALRLLVGLERGALGSPALLLGLHVHLGVGLLLVRAEHHDHVAPVLLGRGLDEAELGDVLGQALQQPEPELGTVLLTTAEHDRDLDLVAGTEEPHDVTLLGLVVVLVDLGTKLHLLDDHVRLVPAGLAGLLGVLVLELAVVHELADRGASLRGDLDEVEVGLLGQLECLVGRHDPNGLTVGSDEPDLGYADPLVDAQLGADTSSSGSGGWEPLAPLTSTRRRTGGEMQKAPAVCQAGASRHTPPLAGKLLSHTCDVRSCGTGPGPDDLWCRAIGAGGRRVVLASAWRDRCRKGSTALIGQHGRLADHSAPEPICGATQP